MSLRTEKFKHLMELEGWKGDCKKVPGCSPAKTARSHRPIPRVHPCQYYYICLQRNYSVAKGQCYCGRKGTELGLYSHSIVPSLDTWPTCCQIPINWIHFTPETVKIGIILNCTWTTSSIIKVKFLVALITWCHLPSLKNSYIFESQFSAEIPGQDCFFQGKQLFI